MHGITGIVTEYNPFHNGHLLHLKEALKLTQSKHIIVVMSGNFVQRGEPSIVDKFQRTKTALLMGADIVFELPLYSATASAEFFAEGAIKMLDCMGIVDYVCFGSEAGDICMLSEISSYLTEESSQFKTALKQKLKEGMSFANAREQALNKTGIDTKQIFTSNNILAIEYLKALSKINSKIKPITIKRQKAEYNSLEISGEIASATAIRNAVFENINVKNIKEVMPNISYEMLKQSIVTNSTAYINNLSQIFHYILTTKSKEYLRKIQGIGEGLENRILDKASLQFYINDIAKEVKTKRYTLSAIKRAILNIILDITKEDFNSYNKNVPYLRVLGFKKESSHLIGEIENKCSIPLIVNIKNGAKLLNKKAFKILEKEIQSTDVYMLAKNNYEGCRKDIEYSMPVIVV